MVVVLLYLLDICQVPSSLLVFFYPLDDPSDLTAMGEEIETQVKSGWLNLESESLLNHFHKFTVLIKTPFLSSLTCFQLLQSRSLINLEFIVLQRLLGRFFVSTPVQLLQF